MHLLLLPETGQLLLVLALIDGRQICFVGHHQDGDLFGGVVAYQGQPGLQAEEGLLPAGFEDQDGAVGVLEVCWDQTLVFLLASGIPELHFAGAAVVGDIPGQEIDADGGLGE